MSALAAFFARWFKPPTPALDALPVQLGRRTSYTSAPRVERLRSFDQGLVAVVSLLR